jgi:hypothetical protein
MDPLISRLDALTDAESHAATIARLEATNASLKTMLERSKSLPSWSEMARTLATLVDGMHQMQARLDVLESECHALRQRELLRFWEDEDAQGTG